MPVKRLKLSVHGSSAPLEAVAVETKSEVGPTDTLLKRDLSDEDLCRAVAVGEINPDIVVSEDEPMHNEKLSDSPHPPANDTNQSSFLAVDETMSSPLDDSESEHCSSSSPTRRRVRTDDEVPEKRRCSRPPNEGISSSRSVKGKQVHKGEKVSKKVRRDGGKKRSSPKKKMDLRELSQELDDEVESQSTSFSSDEEQDQDSEDEKFDNDSIIQEDESYDPISVDEISSVLGVRIQGKCIEYQVSWMADENSADEDHRQESVLMTWENERCLFPQCGPLVRAFMQNKLVLNGIVYSYKSIQNVDIKRHRASFDLIVSETKLDEDGTEPEDIFIRMRDTKALLENRERSGIAEEILALLGL